MRKESCVSGSLSGTSFSCPLRYLTVLAAGELVRCSFGGSGMGSLMFMFSFSLSGRDRDILFSSRSLARREANSATAMFLCLCPVRTPTVSYGK